ncbi:Crp-like helix-turn-helix protein [Winogradskyella wandonensis]|uniref:Crp-like helix-turn-helix protein n=1 Tax=Winogradskyella wandonensis TaxID=1442586 RepID=A0A4R1KK91_9FLAO|nr:response regulator [Winogradskyella wandonensis]TCK64820.1 Crp-like helix-turn-helix protein [Winogradskyella wandonensis]
MQTKVLLIEDDIVLRDNTAELLELLNYQVITASNGKKGLIIAAAETPDIIICDIMMPKMDGYKVLEQLSANSKTSHIPFIFLSAKTEHQDIRKGMNMGADDYITKPFTEDELVSAIKSRLAKVAILKEQRKLEKKVVENEELRSLNDLKNYFDNNGLELSFDKNEIIYNEGDHSNQIYLISKGAVKCHKLDEHGKELTTALYKEDDLFGYTSFTHTIAHKETATAIEKTQLMGVSINQLSEILNNNHKVAVALIDLLTDDLSNVKDQLLEMAYSSVNKKTANTIIQFAEKINRHTNDPIKISRNDLASVAGVATETFIRTLTNFKSSGLIKSEGRNIVVLDLEGLKQIT